MEKTPKILCVDDEKSILRSIRRSFFDEEVIINGVTSGREALEYCKNHEVDCIISDYLMPEMTGCELLNIVKRDYPHIIRIMLSGYVEKEAIVNSLFNFTALTFFSKPWDEDILKRRVYELLHLKLSFSNKTLWAAVNNGFPLAQHFSDFFKDGLSHGTFDKDDSIEDFIKKDITLYIKLLHFGNSYYMKETPVWLLDDLIAISGRDYLGEILKSDSHTGNYVVNYLLSAMQIVTIIYKELYTVLFNQEPPPLPDYVSFIQLDKLVLSSVAPDYIEKRLRGLKSGRFSLLVDKDIVKLMLLAVKVWHLPDIIQKFYISYHSFDLEGECVTESEKQIKALKICNRLADLVLSGNSGTLPPEWWPMEENFYFQMLEKIREIMMK